MHIMHMSTTSINILVWLFLSLVGIFTSSANAAAYVHIGESVPSQYRGRMMFMMAMTSMSAQLTISLFALPIFSLSLRIYVPWLGIVYRSWRLLMEVICIPGILSVICVFFMKESPKFLLCKGKHDETLNVLKTMYRFNTGSKQEFSIKQIYLDEVVVAANADTSVLRKIWNQTAPLFKPPLLMNSLKLYYLLLCAYVTSTGFTMWIPTMVNAYFIDDDKSGKTFCDVASTSAATRNSTVTDCDNTIEPLTLYATMIYSGSSAILNILLSCLVAPFGKKNTTILVFLSCLFCGVLLPFIRVPTLSIVLLFGWLDVAVILGNVNTYLVELNPTHLRGMATCLSVVVARGFGFISVQLIASLVADYCTPLISSYLVLMAYSSSISAGEAAGHSLSLFKEFYVREYEESLFSLQPFKP